MKNLENSNSYFYKAVVQFTSALIDNEKLPKIRFADEEVFSSFYKTVLAAILEKKLSESEQNATFVRLVAALKKHTDEENRLPAVVADFIDELSQSFDLPAPPSAWNICKHVFASVYTTIKEHPWLVGAGILAVVSPVVAAAFTEPTASISDKYDTSLVLSPNRSFGLASVEPVPAAPLNNETLFLPIVTPDNAFQISMMDIGQMSSLAKFSMTEIIEQHYS